MPEHRQLLHLFHDGANVADRLDDIARSRFTLGADHRSAFSDTPQRFTQIARAANERHTEIALVDVMLFIGRRQHFALVDVVDFKRFENPSLRKMADARFRHHRNRHCLHDLADLADRRHARHAALFANIGRHALQRHHRRGARLLRDQRLLGIGDVHDDAAFEHLRQANLQSKLFIQIHAFLLNERRRRLETRDATRPLHLFLK